MDGSRKVMLGIYSKEELGDPMERNIRLMIFSRGYEISIDVSIIVGYEVGVEENVERFLELVISKGFFHKL